MNITEDRKFQAFNATVKAELTNGVIATINTMIEAEGEYRSWHEPPLCEWGAGYTEWDYDIYNDTVKAVYPIEFTINGTENHNEDLQIKKIIEVLNANWDKEDSEIWGIDEDE